MRLLGLLLMLFALLGPLIVAAIWMHAGRSNGFEPGTASAGEAFGLALPLDEDLWGQPATLDRTAVTCRSDAVQTNVLAAHSLGADLPAHQRIRTVSGVEWRYLGRASDASRVECSGGGLATVRQSAHVDRRKERGIAVTVLVATPFVFLVGLVIYRVGTSRARL